jgi:hypothetical protein
MADGNHIDRCAELHKCVQSWLLQLSLNHSIYLLHTLIAKASDLASYLPPP